MEENMQAVGGILGNLKNMATDMGAEIEKQNTQLDRINDKVNNLDFVFILNWIGSFEIGSSGHFRRYYFNLCSYLRIVNTKIFLLDGSGLFQLLLIWFLCFCYSLLRLQKNCAKNAGS